MTKAKKIAIITVASVVAAIIIAIITLAIVQSTFYSPTLNGVKSLKVYVEGTELSVGECTNREMFDLGQNNKGQEIFDEIMNANKTSSNESVLTCIFSGAYGYETSVTEKDTEISEIKATGYVIEYKFQTTQTLTINSEEKKDSDGNKIKYDAMYVVVNDTTDLTETTAYLFNNNDKKSKVKVTYLARQAELFDYIAEIAEA
ncbi:MAG: hypothetical protein E7361_03080 [Clostridiales bacterium]|nr:hypothetical protein [Clostridiales bacterium]